VDPHVWLDPSILDSIADQMAARLSELDPDHTEMFSGNAERLQSDLRELDEEFSRGLANCRSREIVTSHAAFGYLAARYDLKQVSISGIDPEAEPTPAKLAEVATFVKEHHITTIFFEELAPPDLAQTLARETGAHTDVLSPLETPPDNGDYLSEMRLNLKRLETALDCK
jgi:zinc transport system substrate-binding protein